MLKSAIYLNVVILFVASIIFLKKISKSNIDLKSLKKLIIFYLLCDIGAFCSFSLIDVGWNAIVVFPTFVISWILYIIGICRVNNKIELESNTSYEKLNTKKYTIISILPVLIFIIPYIYELYALNNCSYLLEYNYQNGFIQSDDTYIAIVNNRPVNITLQKNLFNRQGVSTRMKTYDVVYTNGTLITTLDSNRNEVVVEDENIKMVAMDAKERSKLAKGAFIEYFEEENYVIITLTSKENSGSILGEYFYSNNKYVKSINTHGSLKSITYYK